MIRLVHAGSGEEWSVLPGDDVFEAMRDAVERLGDDKGGWKFVCDRADMQDLTIAAIRNPAIEVKPLDVDGFPGHSFGGVPIEIADDAVRCFGLSTARMQ